MRQSIGGAWLFSISITLMMFIIAYVAITMDYSNAYQLKNDVTLIIEQYNGLNDDSAKRIFAKMSQRKFSSKIDCAKNYDTSTYYEGAHDGHGANKYCAVTEYKGAGHIDCQDKDKKPPLHGYVCIYKYTATKSDPGATLEKSFYAVTTAFGFNFPILGNIFDYRVTGETAVINYPNDSASYNFNA